MDSYFRARDILDKAMGTDAYFQIKSILFGLKAADVVEVVRCKNCFYYKPFGECNNTGSTVKPDDYCSYGARMDKEAEHETD